MNRRGFLRGIAGILAAGVAPAVIGSNILMPVRKILLPDSVQSVAYFNGRIWLHNSGGAIMTVTAMEYDDRIFPTPLPIYLEAGESLVYDGRSDAFSKMSPIIISSEFKWPNRF